MTIRPTFRSAATDRDSALGHCFPSWLPVLREANYRTWNIRPVDMRETIASAIHRRGIALGPGPMIE